MENWQRTYITKNLPYLIENIECSTLLLSHFLSGGIFSNEDVDKIITIGKSTGKHEQTRVFLDMLTCRSGSYDHLVRTLFVCKRTGACLKLLEGVEEHCPGSNPFLKSGIDIDYQHLLQKKVLFGGIELALFEICALMSHDDVYALMNSLMNVDLYKKLSSESQITLVKQTIPPIISYYIPRSLYFDNELDTTAFSKLHAVFVVQDITSFELKSIAEIASQEIILMDKSSSQLQILTAKFIILETPDHFEKLAKISGKPIYWIRYFDGKLLHLKSSGNEATTLIRRFLKKYRRTTCQEDSFLKMCLEAPRCLPILIYDSPGTGKSTLLASLANKVKQAYQTSSVLFVRMPDLLQFLVSAGGLATRNSLKDFILKITTPGESKLETEVQNILLDAQNHKIELFLDGYDELHEEDTGLCTQMLQLIQEELINIRIWLTSRLNRKDEFEDLFGVSGYRIVPFQNVDQVNFLENYWQTENGIIYSDGLHNLAIKCLDAFKSKVSKAERDFAGIPLQCKLLANICTEYALRENAYFSEEEFTVNSIHSMYKKYVNKQLEETGTGNFHENLKCHTRQALKLFFPSFISFSDTKSKLEHLYKMCIIEPKYDGNPKFVHQTFADYFVAEYVLHFLQTGKLEDELLCSPLQFVFHEVLKNQDATESKNHKGFALSTKRFTHSSIAHFLESGMLEHYLYLKDRPNLADSFKTTAFYRTSVLFDLLNCCLENNLVNLFSYVVCLYTLPKHCSFEIPTSEREIFFNHFGSKQTDSRLFRADFDLASVDYWEVLLLVSCRYSSVTMLKYTCDFVQIAKAKSYHDLDFKNWRMTPMSVATHRGNYEVVSFLLQLSKNQIETWDFPIHECIYNSFTDAPNVVDEKINILKQLEVAQPDIFGSLNTGKDYVLLVDNIHFRLIKFLVENGAKMSKSRKGNNIAHLAATYFSADDFHDLVTLAHSCEYSKIFRQTNKGGFTPFHLALKYMELRPDTIEILGEMVWHGCFRSINSYFTFTLLAFAIEGRRTTRVLDDVMKTYKKFDVSSTFEHNLLCLCLCFNNLKALNFFIDNGLPLNKRCEFKTKTLLSHAMLCNDEFRNKAIDVLINNGVNVNSVFLEQDFLYTSGCADIVSFRFVSPLRFAEKLNFEPDIISLLKSKGASYRKFRCFCYSILLSIFMIFTRPCGFKVGKKEKKSYTRYFSNTMFIVGSVSFLIYAISQIFKAVGEGLVESWEASS